MIWQTLFRVGKLTIWLSGIVLALYGAGIFDIGPASDRDAAGIRSAVTHLRAQGDAGKAQKR